LVVLRRRSNLAGFGCGLRALAAALAPIAVAAAALALRSVLAAAALARGCARLIGRRFGWCRAWGRCSSLVIVLHLSALAPAAPTCALTALASHFFACLSRACCCRLHGR
jgi:hypothetical protein